MKEIKLPDPENIIYSVFNKVNDLELLYDTLKFIYKNCVREEYDVNDAFSNIFDIFLDYVKETCELNNLHYDKHKWEDDDFLDDEEENDAKDKT